MWSGGAFFIRDLTASSPPPQWKGLGQNRRELEDTRLQAIPSRMKLLRWHYNSYGEPCLTARSKVRSFKAIFPA